MQATTKMSALSGKCGAKLNLSPEICNKGRTESRINCSNCKCILKRTFNGLVWPKQVMSIQDAVA